MVYLIELEGKANKLCLIRAKYLNDLRVRFYVNESYKILCSWTNGSIARMLEGNFCGTILTPATIG